MMRLNLFCATAMLGICYSGSKKAGLIAIDVGYVGCRYANPTYGVDGVGDIHHYSPSFSNCWLKASSSPLFSFPCRRASR
jgi:hypothetical protein